MPLCWSSATWTVALVAVALIAFACVIFLTLSTVTVEAVLPNHKFTMPEQFHYCKHFFQLFLSTPQHPRAEHYDCKDKEPHSPLPPRLLVRQERAFVGGPCAVGMVGNLAATNRPFNKHHRDKRGERDSERGSADKADYLLCHTLLLSVSRAPLHSFTIHQPRNLTRLSCSGMLGLRMIDDDETRRPEND